MAELGAPSPAAGDGTPRESAGCTIGILIGLLALAGFVSVLLVQRGTDVDGEALAGEVFGAELPGGFRLEEAARRASGEEVVRLVRAGEAVADEPQELVLVRYSSARGVERLFRSEEESEGGFGGGDQEASRRLQAWKDSPDFDWHTTIEVGDVFFGTWQADYLIERAFFEGGDWQDSAWVNLGRPGKHVALFAIWPRGSTATREQVEDLLSRTELR